MSIKTETCLICDRCGAKGPAAIGNGPMARQAKALAEAKGWVREHSADFGSASKRGMDDLCPACVEG